MYDRYLLPLASSVLFTERGQIAELVCFHFRSFTWHKACSLSRPKNIIALGLQPKTESRAERIHIRKYAFRTAGVGRILLILVALKTAWWARPKVLWAQRPVADTTISRLFPPNTRLQWVRHYRGRFDDITEVLLSLGYDGTYCRGQMTYLQSKESFLLNGTFENGLFVLTESDIKGTTTGQLTGTLQGERLQAEWANLTNTIGCTLYAREVKGANAVPKPCGDNKWAARYVARWNNARLDLVLARQSNLRLNGYLWIEAENRTYTLRGQLVNDSDYEVQALLPNGKVAAHLRGSFQSPQVHECWWIGSGEKRAFKLTQRARLNSGCIEYADYVSSYDLLYPRLECPTCNEIFNRIIFDWLEQTKSAIAGQRRPSTPENRSALRASVWYNISCWTETLFCGQLFFSESWKQPPTARAFNFNLRTGKEIALEDLFNRHFNAREWFADYARKEAPKLPKYAAESPFREWIVKEGFPIVVIRRDGIEICTPFHPVYGQHSLIVPYSLLKPYMRQDNPIADLVR
ncbi:MAG: hypothetical protein NZM43_07780 [Saprospiraceae bacterium]|nr:hypothetical protein [Saprospiraceae bacterium]MDW8484206.1 hypothetical protein [Saprospiraceae bacterium]